MVYCIISGRRHNHKLNREPLPTREPPVDKNYNVQTRVTKDSQVEDNRRHPAVSLYECSHGMYDTLLDLIGINLYAAGL